VRKNEHDPVCQDKGKVPGGGKGGGGNTKILEKKMKAHSGHPEVIEGA